MTRAFARRPGKFGFTISRQIDRAGAEPECQLREYPSQGNATPVTTFIPIDYTAEDFTRIGETFDGLLDAVGKTTYLRCRRLLKPGAIFAGTDVGPWCQTLLLVIWFSITKSKKVIVAMPRPIARFVDILKARMEAGELRAVIDRRYPLENIADAYRYVETGQKTGIVVITVKQSDSMAKHNPND